MLSCLHDCLGVFGPWQFIGDVDTKELNSRPAPLQSRLLMGACSALLFLKSMVSLFCPVHLNGTRTICTDPTPTHCTLYTHSQTHYFIYTQTFTHAHTHTRVYVTSTIWFDTHFHTNRMLFFIWLLSILMPSHFPLPSCTYLPQIPYYYLSWCLVTLPCLHVCT